MKLEQKAYKCAFTNCVYKPLTVWKNSNEHDVIYGTSQKEAVNKHCSSLTEHDTFYSWKQHVRTRRFKEADLYSQEPSQLLKGLTSPQIHNLTHSLGVGIGDRCPVEFHRNYSLYYEKHEGCEYLVTIGLMTNWQKMGSECYAVTEAGKEAVKTLLLVTKA